MIGVVAYPHAPACPDVCTSHSCMRARTTCTRFRPHVTACLWCHTHTHTLEHTHTHTHTQHTQPLRPYHSSYYPEKIYLYTGLETDLYGHTSAITAMKGILRQNHPAHLLKSQSSSTITACGHHYDQGHSAAESHARARTHTSVHTYIYTHIHIYAHKLRYRDG